MKTRRYKTGSFSKHKRQQSKLRKGAHDPDHCRQIEVVLENRFKTSIADFEIIEDEAEEKSISIGFYRKCSLSGSDSRGRDCREISGDGDSNNGKREVDKKDFEGLLPSTREKREQLVERLRIYNSLLKFHKAIKEDVSLYRKLQEMDELYLRNTAAILRLGFCHCLVHRQTSPVGDKLMKIHRKLRLWDKKVEELYDFFKEPVNHKTTAAVLHVLNICENAEKMCETKDTDIVLPEIVWDLENPYIEQLNVSRLSDEWKEVLEEVQEGICKVYLRFQEVCRVFGVTKGPAAIPTTGRKFSYDYDYADSNLSEDPLDEEDELKNEISEEDNEEDNGEKFEENESDEDEEEENENIEKAESSAAVS